VVEIELNIEDIIMWSEYVPIDLRGEMVGLSFIFSGFLELVNWNGTVVSDFIFFVYYIIMDAALKGEWRPVDFWRLICDKYLKSNSNNTLNWFYTKIKMTWANLANEPFVRIA